MDGWKIKSPFGAFRPIFRGELAVLGSVSGQPLKAANWRDDIYADKFHVHFVGRLSYMGSDAVDG